MIDALAEAIRTYPGWSIFLGFLLLYGLLRTIEVVVRGWPTPGRDDE